MNAGTIIQEPLGDIGFNVRVESVNFSALKSVLSFLGVGVQPPTPTWGNMLSGSHSFFKQGPHLVVFPGLLIMITVLCLYVIGDGLRDAFDPKTVD